MDRFCEKNLPLDVHSRQRPDLGEPGRPRPALAIEALREKAGAGTR